MQTFSNQPGVITLQKLLIREKAGGEKDSRGIYIISSNPANPEMYELKVQSPKDKNVWIQSIRAAVVECPPDESKIEDNITADQRQRNIDEKQATIRELIGEFFKLFLIIIFAVISPMSSLSQWLIHIMTLVLLPKIKCALCT